ncbi:MAG TPA: phospholipase D-like domain-containing protein [Candidatus Dormibacteraeota bacterium]|nr:phospholipase D-like domain-containing protein [Candidatus Dormibacteraeota bacterium]
MGNIRSSRQAMRCLVLAAALAGCGQAAVAAPAPHGAFARSPAYPTVAGPAVPVGDDSVSVLPRGVVAFPVIRGLLEHARQRIDLEMYELARADLVGALIGAHRRGVAVTVIVDASVVVTAAAAAQLRGDGVDVIDYPVRKMMIDHVKLLVVDGDVAVVGGINWGTGSAANHDFDALVRGPAAANLEDVFLGDLVTCGREVVAPPQRSDAAILVATTLPGTAIRPLAMQLIEEARQSIDLELYVLTDAGIVHAVERAQRRGVAVRVLLDPDQRPSDPSAAELRAAGVDLRVYHGGGEKLHAKVGVADGRRVLMGSANWTRSGFERNHELDIEVLDSAVVAGAFEAAMAADWAASAS